LLVFLIVSVTADDYSSIKVFNAPCVAEGAPSLKGNGHSSHVECARWLNVAPSENESHTPTIVSVGADSTVLVWELNKLGDKSEKGKDSAQHRSISGFHCENRRDSMSVAHRWSGVLAAAEARQAFGRGHGCEGTL
jgi:hypothetical protein